MILILEWNWNQNSVYENEMESGVVGGVQEWVGMRMEAEKGGK